ncbi:nickel ABC transporter substrate-binding protein [Fusobacterium russii]|uniref:nickel ABC transporter substrate-binding protein n=1 Tax=Fusobacterium russii TaxID=854 RepID=UPI00039C56BF|nr:nickel ABC transporter substrate-binding protein [Fusobacterium russii]
MRLKKFLKVFLLASVCIFTLLACNKETTKEKEIEKKVLTLSWNQDIGFVNPHVYLPDQFITQAMVYEGLVNYGENGVILPSLAEKWDISEDGKVYTFHLRKGVKFSDGSDFNAYNVEKNFQTLVLQKENHSWFGLMEHLESFRVLDENTFEIVLSSSYTPALYDLAMIRPIRFLADASFPDNGDTSTGIKSSIGTGPWILKEHKKDEYAIFEKNPNYWGEKPILDEVVIKIIPDAETRALQFEAGELDLIYGNGLISYDTFKSYSENKEYKTLISEPMSTRLIMFNATTGPLTDIKLRQALTYATNKKAISEGILNGIESVADTIFAPNMPHSNQNLTPYEYSLDKAKELLGEAGWKQGKEYLEKDGKVLTLVFPYIATKTLDKQIAEYIQAQWKEIGVKVEIVAVEEKKFWEDMDDLKYNIMLNYSWGAPWDPHAYINAMATPAEHGNPDYKAQRDLPIKKELDKKIHQALVETDEAKVEELYKEILTILHEQAVYVPLTYQSLVAVYKDNLEGVRFMPQEYELPLIFINKK